MPEIIDFKNFNEFIEYNFEVLHESFIVNFYLIKAIEKVEKREIGIYDSFNIIDSDGSYLTAMWLDGCYMLFCTKWNDDVLSALSTKIDLSKFRRFLFNGSKPFILAFFKATQAQFHIVKDRISYKCDKVNDSFHSSSGRLEMASMSDLDELAKMSFEYSQEEYNGKGRDYEHMRQIVSSGIIADNFYVWRDKGEICTIAQVIDTDDEPPFIGHLFTIKSKRNQGYACSILYEITKGLLIEGHEACGLVSDATNPTSNRVFIKVGYTPIGEYISGTKEMWSEEDID